MIVWNIAQFIGGVIVLAFFAFLIIVGGLFAMIQIALLIERLRS